MTNDITTRDIKGLSIEDDLYDIDEFRADCEFGGLIDYDGFGYAVIDNQVRNDIIVKPSKVENIPKGTTHVVWFNR